MTVDWARVQNVLDQAAERDADELPAFLDRACAGDGALRDAVAGLLGDGDDEGAAFIEAAVAAGASAVLGAERRQGRGQHVGSYRLIRPLGRGGMSTVYLAVRADRQFHKRVAIKVVRRGMDTDDILDRFRSERQILASLDHANIARLLDGGTTDDGLPYFVMEYIDGLPIGAFCDRERLSVDQRLALFRQVCAAVHYAHQNLVVHRDIKPSNVLVTARGEPKLLDFGIAKLLNPELSDRTTEPTSRTRALMTPSYASPEQIRGGPVTTSSDVYSLGVLLYELLTGHRPYRLPRHRPQDLERAICEQAPERPSQAVERLETRADDVRRASRPQRPETVSRDRHCKPEQLRRRLRGDLDTIVLMALRKEPERRYGSVAQLAEDIERHRRGHPVIARPDTFGYRTTKFVQRHRLGVAAAAGLLLVVVGLVVLLAVQSIRVSRERDRAAQVSSLLADLFRIADNTRGSTITARELLDRGARRVLELDEGADAAMLLATVAQLYVDLRLYDSAEPLFQRALEIRRRTLGEHHPEVADTVAWLGRVRAEQGDFQGAKPLFAEALALRRTIYGNHHQAVARSLNGLALVHHDLGNYRLARPLYEEGVEMANALLGSAAPLTTKLTNNYALLLYDEGSYEEAQRLFQRVLDATAADRDSRPEALARSRYYLGIALEARGHSEPAERHLRQALAVQRQVLGAEHHEIARSLHHLGGVLRARGALKEAEALLDEGLAMRLGLLGEHHPEVAASLEALATLRLAAGQPAQAESLYRRALRVYGESLPAEHPLIGSVQLALGALLAEGGDCARAAPLLDRALLSRSKALPDDNWEIAEARGMRALCHPPSARDEARRQLASSHASLAAHLGPDHPRVRRLAGHLAALPEPARLAARGE